jgi:hypothetical protein
VSSNDDDDNVDNDIVCVWLGIVNRMREKYKERFRRWISGNVEEF